MKLQLMHTIEGDGNWFKVVKDGLTERCFGYKDEEDKHQALKCAEDCFASYEAAAKAPVSEVLIEKII